MLSDSSNLRMGELDHQGQCIHRSPCLCSRWQASSPWPEPTENSEVAQLMCPACNGLPPHQQRPLSRVAWIFCTIANLLWRNQELRAEAGDQDSDRLGQSLQREGISYTLSWPQDLGFFLSTQEGLSLSSLQRPGVLGWTRTRCESVSCSAAWWQVLPHAWKNGKALC